MFIANIERHLPLLIAQKYTRTETTLLDFTLLPRAWNIFILVLSGSGILETDTETMELQARDILFIPVTSTYKMTWLKDTTYLALHFSFHPQNDPFFNKNIPIQPLSNERFDDLLPTIERISKYTMAKDEKSFFALSAFYEICGILLPQIQTKKNPSLNKAVLPAIEYIQKNYNEKIPIEELATMCFLSPSRFHFLFKKATGMSPIFYKNRIMIQHCAQSLMANTEKSILEIAKEHGFDNLIYFERAFKKSMGQTPSQYRKEKHPL